MIKKVFSIVFSLGLTLSLIGCGAKNVSKEDFKNAAIANNMEVTEQKGDDLAMFHSNGLYEEEVDAWIVNAVRASILNKNGELKDHFIRMEYDTKDHAKMAFNYLNHKFKTNIKLRTEELGEKTAEIEKKSDTLFFYDSIDPDKGDDETLYLLENCVYVHFTPESTTLQKVQEKFEKYFDMKIE